ncbi:MAG: TonB-dependent receptor [Candidatus Doudnabacteria bacterium]
MYSININRLLPAILIFFLISYNILPAENYNCVIKGKVLSNEGIALYGAHIALPSLSRGTVTNDKGEFIIANLPKGKHRLVISYIGYESEIRMIDFETENVVELVVKLKPTTIQTETIVVTGNPYATDPLNSPQDVSSLSGREKLKSEASSLGKTLENMPGIYNLSAGSVAGKPVVRGHTGERVLILSDGVTQEYQQYGERHSPNIEASNYDRIEVIKGAASLLYGSDAMGGAVNLIPHPFHFAQDNNYDVSGSLSGGYFSNNNEYMSGIRLNGSTELLSLNANLVKRKADNFNTPDVDPYSKTLKRGDPKFTGEIPNTNFEQLNGSLGVGFLSPIGIFSVDYDHYLNKNNFLLPDGGPIGLRLENQIVNIKGNIPLDKFIVKPKFSYQRNHRQATQAGLSYSTLPDSAAVDLILGVYTARVEVENVDIINLSGTTGVEVKYYDHENIGKVPLQPTGNFTNYALFLFEEWQKGKLILNFGARFDYRDQIFYGTTTNPLLTKDDKRSYSNLSGSFGAAYKFTNQFTVTGNISRGFRTPSFYNLYVYGEHGGVFAFQIGNPNLKNETSLDLNSSVRFRNEMLNANISVFHNTINNYIFLYNAPDHPLAPANAPFVFAHDQADALITGLELSVNAGVFNWLLLSGSYSLIKSEFTSGSWKDGELPLMPPNRLTLGAKFLLPSFAVIKSSYISIVAKFVSSKNAAGIYEPFGQFDDGIGPDIPFGVCSTEKYNLVDLGFGFDLCLYDQPISFDLAVTNLFNEVYRDFLDTYKGYALSLGRSINIKINLPFN